MLCHVNCMLYMCIFIQRFKYIYIYIYICTCAHICTHMHVCVCMCTAVVNEAKALEKGLGLGHALLRQRLLN